MAHNAAAMYTASWQSEVYAHAEFSDSDDPDLDDEDRQASEEMFEAVVGMVRVSREAAESIQGFHDILSSTARQSRDLRPAIGLIRQGLRGVLDAQGILDEWERLIQERPRA